MQNVLLLGGEAQPAVEGESEEEVNRRYCKDVLELQEHEAETQLDERLRNEAGELGLDVVALLAVPQTRDVAEHTLSRTCSLEEGRRSASIDSKASRSTGLTSILSTYSRDPRYDKNISALGSLYPERDTASRGRRDGRRSLALAQPVSSSLSTYSLPSSPAPDSPKKAFRHLRGLSFRSLRRTDTSPVGRGSCPHCPKSASSRKGAEHWLLCGHCLCTQAIRQKVWAAANDPTGSRPGCCGMPLSCGLIESVMRPGELSALTPQLERWDNGSIATFGSLEHDASIPVDQKNDHSTMHPPKVDPVTMNNVEAALQRLPDSPDLRRMVKAHKLLTDRFSCWAEQRRTQLQQTYDRMRAESIAKHDSALDQLHEQHHEAMAEAEDKQVQAEATMREVHANEKRDQAAALKHMEAYCNGTYSNGQPHCRIITDQDLSELARARKVRDAMDAKHQSAINVLRGEQGRRIRLRAQRQEAEVRDAERANKKYLLDLEQAHTKALDDLQAEIDRRKRGLDTRWKLQVAIFMKRMELTTTNTSGPSTVCGAEETAPRGAVDTKPFLAPKAASVKPIRSGGPALLGQA